MPAHIDLLDGVAANGLFNLVDDALVLEDGAVVAEVDIGGLRFEDGEAALCVVVALLERGEGVEGITTEAKGGRETGPVDL